MKRILLPTDFSPNAWNAISYALRLFKDERCKFYFLHTYIPAFYRVDYMFGGPAYSGLPDKMINISLSGLEKAVKRAREQYPNPKHSYETISSFNILSDEINEVVKRERIHMIIMGTQGATGAKEVFLGTNTVFVMRKAKVPVLAIPEDCKYQGIDNILFPSDYWSFYKRRELKPMLDMLKKDKGNVTILHVTEEYGLTKEQEKNKEFLAECFEGIPYEFDEVKSELMPDAIHNYIDKNHFDMAVMMNRKHSFLERLLFKQNVDAIGFHIKIPFLVLRDTSKKYA